MQLFNDNLPKCVLRDGIHLSTIVGHAIPYPVSINMFSKHMRQLRSRSPVQNSLCLTQLSQVTPMCPAICDERIKEK